MRDADILTVDRYTFVGDERFESHFSETRETWSLIIKYVQERDAGLYECQVSTEPKMSQLFSLRVVIPKVEIYPPGDRYMKAGSRVQIDCHIKNVVMLPDYIFWYHGDVRLMENKEDNIIVTVKRTGPEAITSTLTILDVPTQATGNYTCMPSNLHASTVNLHVLNEKNPEAMQGDRSAATGLSGPRGYQLLLMLFLLMLKFESDSLSVFRKEEAEPETKPEGGNNSRQMDVKESPVASAGIMAFPRRVVVLILAGCVSLFTYPGASFARFPVFSFGWNKQMSLKLSSFSSSTYSANQSNGELLTPSLGLLKPANADCSENGNGFSDISSSEMDVSG
ncbi:uncharacterized protein [Palaemon carinicauda]|uniref:uncharacterized protein n=1 Tax=Palaemon carinicauda TaxID=392227 RepID=UPI0035B6755C